MQDNIKQQQQKIKSQIIQCPYLSSVKRHLLDFDIQVQCSISLSTINVYGCLVCGKFYQGRSTSTPAYQHSISMNHHIFINMQTTKIYCLPQNYQVIEHTLNDIKFNLKPVFSKQILKKLYLFQPKYNIDGKQYIPGILGLNNLKDTDYVNCVFQLLNTVQPLRQFFLLNQQFQNQLLIKMSWLFKKIWNWQQFKGTISPNDFMMAVVQKSNKIFKIGKRSDPANFLIWLLDNIQKLMKKQKKNHKIIQLFQGQLKTSYIKGIKNSAEYQNIPTKIQKKNFTIIRLQFPQRGIFNKVENCIDIKDMMQFYLGIKGRVQGQGLIYTQIINYPKYFIICFKRFSKNQYNIQKDTSQVIYNGKLEIQGHSYKLIAQIIHEGKPQAGKYKTNICFNERWFQIQDLVVNEILKKQMLLSQPYIQLYQKIN